MDSKTYSLYSIVSTKRDSAPGKHVSPKQYRKYKRNKRRICRRKRKRFEYWSRRKEQRTQRYLENRFTAFDITEESMGEDTSSPMFEVHQWAKDNELAYWQSRAIELQMENVKLSKLLYTVCKANLEARNNTQTTHSNIAVKGNSESTPIVAAGTSAVSMKRPSKSRHAKILEWVPVAAEESNSFSRNEDEDDYYGEETGEEDEELRSAEELRSSDERLDDVEYVDEIQEPELTPQENSERLKKLYGPMASKIGGMETALQLSYDLWVKKHKPILWPNIPLKL